MESKKCIKCGLLISYERMSKDRHSVKSYYCGQIRVMSGSVCSPCFQQYQLKRRAAEKDARDLDPKIIKCKYEKTRKGFLMRTYRNMKSRVLGIQKLKAHLYKGVSLLPKDEFYAFSLASEDYNRLFDAWVNSNFSQRITPSIDRIDSKLGYEINNMRWITHSENSSLGASSKWLSKRDETRP